MTSATDTAPALNDEAHALLQSIIGRKSADIEKALGFRGRDEIVHRDDLVLLRIL